MSDKVSSAFRPLTQAVANDRPAKSLREGRSVSLGPQQRANFDGDESSSANPIETKLHEVANLYEKQFLREMVKQMRATVPESGFVKINNAEKIFREQLDDQYVDKWSSNGGVGFSDLIFNQLVEKFGPQLGLKAPVQKPTGPLPFSAKDHRASAEFRNTEKGVSVKLNTTEREVRSPWAGVLLRKIETGPEENFLEIQHENGFKSQLLFKGLAPSLGLPSNVVDGQRLGLLSPDKGQLVWNIERAVSE